MVIYKIIYRTAVVAHHLCNNAPILKNKTHTQYVLSFRNIALCLVHPAATERGKR